MYCQEPPVTAPFDRYRLAEIYLFIRMENLIRIKFINLKKVGGLIMFEVNTEDAWELMGKLKSYEDYKNRFSNVDVLKLLNENTPTEEIINKIIIKIHKEISEDGT